MKFPSIKSLSAEQLPAELRGAVKPLLDQLSPFLLSLSTGLDRSLTFGDNLAAQIKALDITTPDDWIPVPASGEFGFQNGWVNYPGVVSAYKKTPGGQTTIRGLIRNGTIATTAFLLPATYRAGENRFFGGMSDSAAIPAAIETHSDGVVNIRTGGTAYQSLECIFDALDRSPVPASCFPLSYASTLSSKAIGLWPVAAYVVDANARGVPDPAAHLGPLSVEWEESTTEGKRTVKIRNIVGLLPKRLHRITLLSIAG